MGHLNPLFLVWIKTRSHTSKGPIPHPMAFSVQKFGGVKKKKKEEEKKKSV